MGARGRRDGSSGAEADDDVSAGAGVKERRSEAALEWAAGSPWAASSPWEPFVKRYEVHNDSDF